MKQARKFTSLIIMLVSIILISACGTAETSEPTLDANMIYTQAAQTVQAQISQTAAAMPTATSTNTPVPTATEIIATQTPINVVVTSAVASPTQIASTNPNKMQFIKDVNYPDGTSFAPGEKFTKIWLVKNIGETTWGANYKIRFWAGNQLGAPTSVLLGKEVKPNTEVEISIDFTAPGQAGEYTSQWVLSTNEEANFGTQFYVKIVVGNPPTATATAKPSATSQPTQTATTAPTLTPIP